MKECLQVSLKERWVWKWALQFRHHWKVQFPYLVGCTGRQERERTRELNCKEKQVPGREMVLNVWGLSSDEKFLPQEDFYSVKNQWFYSLTAQPAKNHMYIWDESYNTGNCSSLFICVIDLSQYCDHERKEPPASLPWPGLPHVGWRVTAPLCVPSAQDFFISK